MTRPALPVLTFALALIFLVLAFREGVRQHGEDLYVLAATQEALSKAQGSDLDSKLTAIRDFVRNRVRDVDFYARRRPFLRDTSADTLLTGKGRCGEATRVFVNMASAAGISAHRLYLEGDKPHVVAIVNTEDGGKLVVDSTNRFYLPENEPLSQLARNPQFTSYSTFGFRRLRILRALPSNAVNLGPLNYVLENPHALIACLWLLPSVMLFGITILLKRRIRRRSIGDSEREFSVMTGLSGGAEV